MSQVQVVKKTLHGLTPVTRLSSESIIASSGPFSYGMAYCEIDDVEGE